tara:strand:- start:3921 stop:4604 length:684 start_codon:yes stop_codon:yes gene_type:complete
MLLLLLVILILILFFNKNKIYENFNLTKKFKKIYIITPSLCREKLNKTCNSIYNQTYKNWEHIIMFDNVNNSKINKFLKKCKYKPTIIKGKWNNYGNGQRYDGWKNVKENSIITYIDDDDYYIDNNVFKKIANKFASNKNLDVVFWEGMRFGELFNNKPPRKFKTMSNQFAHLKYDKFNKPIRWGKYNKNESIPGRDGDFVNKLVKNYNYSYIDEPLVVVEAESKGK